MKKTKLFGWAFVALASFSACTNDTEDILTQESEIKLTSEIAPSRLTSLEHQSTQIVTGQKVGVTITGAKSEHNNIAWAVGENGALTNTGDAIYYGNGTATITAYHPFNDDWNENTTYAFSVSTDQTDASDYVSSDLLWATATSSKTETTIPLTFTHKLAKINVTLVPEIIGDDLNGATISIYGTKISTTFNPITGTVSAATGEPQEIIASVTADNVYTASAIVIPQEVSGKFIKITHEGKTYYYTLDSAKILASGKSYSYTLTIKDKQLINTGSSINPWNPDSEESEEGDAEEDVSKLTITLTEAGTLSSIISEDARDVIQDLTIIGEINGTDIRYLRKMAGRSEDGTSTTGKLIHLDLTNAKIVTGGDYYFKLSETQLHTEDNIAGDYMFYQCSLQTIKFPTTVTKLGRDVCSHLGISDYHTGTFTSIVIPNSVKSIGIHAFAFNQNMRTIEIPESVIEMNGLAFYRCDALSEIYIPNSVNKMLNEFQHCWGLTKVHLPENSSFNSIYSWTFSGCKSLKSLTLPSNITTIESGSFGNTQNQSVLEELHCRAATPPYLKNESGLPLSCKIYVPSGSSQAYKTSNSFKNYTIIEE